MKGFTLVEILVSVVILGFLFAATYGVLNVGNIIFKEDITLVGLQQQVRLAMVWMVRELRESGSTHVNSTEDGTIVTFQVPVDWDNDGLWRDKNGDEKRDKDEYIWDVFDADGNTEWGATLHYHCRDPQCESVDDEYNTCHYLNYGIRYLVSNGQLVRRFLNGYPTGTQVGEDLILANDIASLNFSLSGNILEICLATKKTVGTRELCFPAPCEEPPKTFKEIVTLRNENG